MSKRKTTLILSVAAIAACFLVPLFMDQRVPRNKPSLPDTPAPSPPKTATPVSLSQQTADVALAREIERTIDTSDLTRARWGVFVTSMKDGRVLVSRNGDKLFTPASNMKVYTTAAALDLLGTDYRWRTSVYADAQPDSGGVINGNLTLFGRGAPDLQTKSIASLADRIYQRGVRQVRGNIVGDESYFRGELYGLGWQWNDLQWYFGAEPSALTVDENSFDLTITPAKKVGDSATLTLNRAANYVHLSNHTTTADRGAMTTTGINRGLADDQVLVRGGVPAGGRAFRVALSLAQPSLWAATLLQEALIARGSTVDGAARGRDALA